jgi:hypothetical protein
MWVKAEDVPKADEGKRAWKFTRWGQMVEMSWVPRDYSRDPRHCVGVWFMPIEQPAPPEIGEIQAAT